MAASDRSTSWLLCLVEQYLHQVDARRLPVSPTIPRDPEVEVEVEVEPYDSPMATPASTASSYKRPFLRRSHRGARRPAPPPFFRPTTRLANTVSGPGATARFWDTDLAGDPRGEGGAAHRGLARIRVGAEGGVGHFKNWRIATTCYRSDLSRTGTDIQAAVGLQKVNERFTDRRLTYDRIKAA